MRKLSNNLGECANFNWNTEYTLINSCFGTSVTQPYCEFDDPNCLPTKLE